MVDLRLVIEKGPQDIGVTLYDAQGRPIIAESSTYVPDLSLQSAEQLGRELASVGLPKRVRQTLSRRIGGAPVRLWLDVKDAKLAAWPWEYLWLDEYDLGHLAQHPLVRILRGDGVAAPCVLRTDASTRILLAFADPQSSEFGPLPQAEAEMDDIRRTLDQDDRFEVRELRHATPDSLLRQIGAFRPHLVHLIGHGKGRPSPLMAMETGVVGQHAPLYGEQLAQEMKKAQVQVAILSGCHTGAADGSVCAELARAKVPYVIGMQSAIHDSTGPLFSLIFYHALVRGDALDTALHQARCAIRGCGNDWAAPVMLVSEETPEAPVARVDAGPKLPPTAIRPIVGRVRERQDLWRKLRQENRRMVTICGMGGMGKTGLAQQILEDLQCDYPQSTHWTACDGLSLREQVIGASAQSLGLSADSTLEAVCEAVGDSRRLMVFDCFERVCKESEVLDRMLTLCPRLQILVTSRHVLNSPWEHAYELKPLSRHRSFDRSERVELLLEAAQQARGDLQPTPEVRRNLQELADLLEGVPLAMILAAGRLRYLSLVELTHRLRIRLLDTLRTPGQHRGRHASMRIVIEDSFDLMAPDERSTAFQLSVFQGGFSLDDVAAVLGTDAEDRVLRLCDQSIFVSESTDFATRFKSLDTIQEFLSEASAEVDLQAVRERHARHFVDKAISVRELFDDGKMAEAAGRTWMDMGNYRAALEYAGPEDLPRLARALARLFLEAGATTEFDLLAKRADEFSRRPEQHPLRLELLGLRGTRQRRRQNYEGAVALWQERTELAREHGLTEMVADTLLDMADLHLAREDRAGCETCLIEFEALPAEDVSPGLRASALLLRGRLHPEMNAADLAEQAIRLIEDQPPSPSSFFVLINAARIFRTAQQLTDSETYARQMVKKAMECQYYHYAGVGLLHLAETYLDQGKSADAARVLILAMALGKAESGSILRRAKSRAKELEKVGAISPADLIPERGTAANWKTRIQEAMVSASDF